MCQSHYHNAKVAFTRRWTIALVSAALWLVLCAGPAWAHKVTIFAWVEGDTVYTQSKFSGGKRAKDSTVVVYDKEGNQLLEGKTDDNGEFSFQVPKKTDLKIVLKASMGHLAEWTIPAEEITGVAQASESSAPEVSMEAETEETAPLTEAETSQPQPAPTAVGLSRQEVQALINESLDRKLAPIVNMLADAVDPGPTLSEVIGGIGYIFGLVGVALYFSTRGKRK
jgi:nickel transport protein